MDTSQESFQSTVIESAPLFDIISHVDIPTTGKTMDDSLAPVILSLKPLQPACTFEDLRKQLSTVLEIISKQSAIIKDLSECISTNNNGINSIVDNTNQMAQVVDVIRKSSESQSDQIERLKECKEQTENEIQAINTRVDRLETIQEAKESSSKLNLILLCSEEMTALENNNSSLRSSVLKIFQFMHVNFSYNLINAVRIRSGMRVVDGEKKFVKFVQIEFTSDKVAGNIFAQIVAFNSNTLKNKETPRYYAEMPAGKRIVRLRYYCNKLRLIGGVLLKVFTNHQRSNLSQLRVKTI
jgi:vacuolar-type H+-ATPase subunit I/STV1